MGADEYNPPATDIITLTRHVLNEGFRLRKQSAASGDLTILLSSLQTTWYVQEWAAFITERLTSDCE